MEKAIAVPEVYRSRSIYHKTPVTTLSFNAGKLVPFKSIECYPGDTVKMDLRTLIRMSTPVGVPMDNLYLDVFWFFVPNKYLLRRQSFTPSTNDGNRSWEAISGGQDGAINMPAPGNGIKMAGIMLAPKDNANTPLIGGFWDCMGQAMFPGGTGEQVTVNPMDYLAYCSIWNENFRDPNGSMNRIFFSIQPVVSGDFNGSFTFSGGPTGFYSGNPYYLNAFDLLPVCRFHGYFGSCLPWPQRNVNPVTVPIGSKAYVYAELGGSVSLPVDSPKVVDVKLDGDNPDEKYTLQWNYNSTSYGSFYADLSNAVSATVNAVRASFAKQRWYEALARGGNGSYDDLVAAIWGVSTGRLREGPEFLASKRIPLNIIQVNDTATDLGKTGSFSHTRDDEYMFTKSFSEHGVLMGLCCVRHEDTFHQGIDKKYFRSEMFDYYQPQFAHIGEEPVTNGEICFTGQKGVDDGVFGYMEYASDLRLDQNHVCGLLRPGQSLGYWTAASNFSSVPSLGDFLDATGQIAEIDRLLKVSHTLSGFQFIGQFCTDYVQSRLIPTRSDPGLIDHD